MDRRLASPAARCGCETKQGRTCQQADRAAGHGLVIRMGGRMRAVWIDVQAEAYVASRFPQRPEMDNPPEVPVA